MTGGAEAPDEVRLSVWPKIVMFDSEMLRSWKPESPPNEKLALPPSEKTFVRVPLIGTLREISALVTSTSTRPPGFRLKTTLPLILKMPAASIVRLVPVTRSTCVPVAKVIETLVPSENVNESFRAWPVSLTSTVTVPLRVRPGRPTSAAVPVP